MDQAAERIDYCSIQPSGLRLGYVSRGQGPLVMFLHGFPDTYRGFLPILDRLAEAGHRAIAPAMRGYAHSAVPATGDYRVETLAADVVGLATALGADRFTIVGHDWGAVAGYAAANLAPSRVSRLICAAIPHTGHFLVRLRARQLLRSRYMLRFQIPRLPEWEIPRNDFAWLEGLIRSWSPSWNFSDTELRPLKDNFTEPKRLRAALAYYRQLPASLSSELSRRLMFSPIACPTRIIYGLQDGCIGPEMFEGQQPHFSSVLDLVAMPDAGHFMQWEQPERFAQLVREFLGPPRAGL